MRINRALLYSGAFLVAIGGVAVLADQGSLDTATLADVLRLWPLVPIAIGVALVTRRTRVSLAGGVAAAVVPGLLIGSAVSIIPRYAGDCGARLQPVPVANEAGTLTNAESIVIRTGCGSAAITTRPGSGWALTAANSAGRPPIVDWDVASLSISGQRSLNLLGGGRDAWDVSLPTSPIGELSLVANVSRSRVTLPGADIATLRLTANLSDVVVDLTGARIGELSVASNMSPISLRLASTDLVGTIKVGGAELQLCVPPDVGLNLHTHGPGSGFTIGGAERSGPEWRSPGYDAAPYHAELDVRTIFSSLAIDPIGGCR